MDKKNGQDQKRAAKENNDAEWEFTPTPGTSSGKLGIDFSQKEGTELSKAVEALMTEGEELVSQGDFEKAIKGMFFPTTKKAPASNEEKSRCG